MSIFTKIFGSKHDRDIKQMRPILDQVNSLEEKMSKMNDDELKNQTLLFKERLSKGESLHTILPEAFATVREGSKRVLGMRPFDVQILGGIVLLEGKIAEMKTGEGKTLCATLPLYLKALEGKGAHLVTVNDYLASRDANDMGKLFKWLGLTVGCITNDLDDTIRKQQYACDITYGTNNELAWDYLRDNMKFDLSHYVQREHHYCIVDEVDSILIDEARTPLLISGPSESRSGLYLTANKVIPKLSKLEDFTIDEKNRSAIFTEAGILKVQSILNIENLYNMEHTDLLHHLNQALRAHHLFTLDVDYVIKDRKVIIVDEFTGRLKEGSRWSDGLHQAIEAKENVPIKNENQTLASITFQNYFRLYKTLAGMTGTADTEAEEFNKIYNLDVVVIPTNKPMIRIDEPDIVYPTSAAKYDAISELLKQLYDKGQPVLVGTISIENSELLSSKLRKLHIPHEVLNAKQHFREAEIIKNAGNLKSITIATNMAGRGTDIKIPPDVINLGGLFILGTERHESRRIDNQLRGRSGRQGDPGQSKFFLSLEDNLLRIFGSARMTSFMNTFGMKQEPIEHRMITKAIAKSQKKVEAYHFEVRKHLLEYDDVLNGQREVIYRIRREILEDKENKDLILQMIEDVVINLVEGIRPPKAIPLDQWNWDEINNTFNNTFNSKLTLKADGVTDLTDHLYTQAKSILHDRLAEYDEEQVRLAVREILLSTFDKYWKDHLLSMDHLKEGINLSAYAQRDPLTEYKREGLFLFENMRETIKRTVVNNIYRVRLYTAAEIEIIKKRQEALLAAQMASHKQAEQQKKNAELRQDVKSLSTKTKRNEPCPCGSGKKYKHCHGA